MTFLYYNTVVTGLVSQIDTLMVTFVHNGYNALASALKAPLTALGTLSIVLLGYGITQGFIKSPMKTLYIWILKMGLIMFFAMNWGNFSFYVVGLFDKGAGELSAAVMKANHAPIAGKSIADGLQSVFTDVFRVGMWTMKKSTLRNWWPVCTAFFIWISGIAVIAVALFEIIVAKILLSICLATAPLFVIFILFDKTRSFFDRWLGSVVGFSLVLIFVSMVIGLCISLIHASIAGYLPEEAASMDAMGWAPIFLVACFCIACLVQAANIAKHIGGACHTAGGPAMVGGVAGVAAAAAVLMMKSYKSMNSMRQNKNNGGGLGYDDGGLTNNSQESTQYSTRGEL